MANGVFLYRSDSIYEDVPSEFYRFPKQYLKRVQQTVGDWILYLEPSKVPETRSYFAVAWVEDVIADHANPDMFLALIEPNAYLDFGTPVPFRDHDGIVERSVLNEHGRISGRAQAAVRVIPPEDFSRIVDRGLVDADDVLPRTDVSADAPGFAEQAATFTFDGAAERSTVLVNRAVRDRNFRRAVLTAYGEPSQQRTRRHNRAEADQWRRSGRSRGRAHQAGQAQRPGHRQQWSGLVRHGSLDV